MELSFFDMLTLLPLIAAFAVATVKLAIATKNGDSTVQWIRALGMLTALLFTIFYVGLLTIHVSSPDISPHSITIFMQTTRIINTLVASLFLIWAFGWRRYGRGV